MNWYKLSVEETKEQLDVDLERGLSSDEARGRLERFGPNELEERGRVSSWRILFRQFQELMVIILIIAAIISLVLGEYVDMVVILAIVIINAAIGYSQEQRAEEAMAALKKMAIPTVRVRRDAEVKEISSTDLVPGDIVLLEAGNVVPADGRIIEGANLKAQESALTGESEPVEKLIAIPGGENLTLGDRSNMVYMGTSITYGRGAVVVTETGMSTELGHIAGLIQKVDQEQTPLQRRLESLGKTLTVIAVAIIAVVILTGYFLRGEELRTLLLTGISLAVAVIPEGLPAVVTITLALGSQRLLKRKALIRKLPAVETLGSVTVICSDKTGTLTENQMTVTILDVAGNREDIEALVSRKGVLLEAEWASSAHPAMTALSVLVRAGALCNDAVLKKDPDGSWRAIGDPTEGALLLAAKKLGFDKEELDEKWPRVAEVPFTSERKRMTTVHQVDEARQSDLPWRDTPYVLLSKGAVDSLLQVSNRVLVDNEIVEIDDEWRQRIEKANDELARQGQRVLGIAFRFCEAAEPPTEEELLEVEEVFVGLVAMIDPPRPEAEAAVATAKEAGIRPVMITGDHPLTAIRIAQDLGITDRDHCLTGAQLSQMKEPELRDVVGEVSVYARVSPEHKLNIVEALQTNGQIAAMTGDGVNDAPALKRADIGVAMGVTGTDVSKEASDMVLLDDNFATIVAAVEEGRVIYDNVRKFIRYTLSSNTGELFLMLVAPFLGMPLPLLPLQILWVNLVTDGLPGIALAQEKGEPGVMQRPPFKPTESIFSRGLGGQIIWIGSLMGLVSLVVGYVAWRNEPGGHWQTMVFTTLVLSQMGNALAIRSNKLSLFSIGFFSNRLMVNAVLGTLALQLLLIYLPPIQSIFNTEALSLAELVICLAASIVVFVVIEIYKWFLRRRDDTTT
ncbi:MAG: cation-translocating P-type ATPase [Chloroflexota bacterium]|jgi:Ca2+-transporting ATPase